MGKSGRNLQQELIEEGIRQIQRDGVKGFSSRAVAEACQVSCAAPFKHFNGRKAFFSAMADYLDQELLKIMDEIENRKKGDYKGAHLEMNVAYLQFLCKYPFLIDSSFWQTIHEGQAGIRKWASFQKMIGQFLSYCKAHNIPQNVLKSYYFNFQALAYGSAFVVVNQLLLEGEDPMPLVLDIQERIYKNMEMTMGLIDK